MAVPEIRLEDVNMIHDFFDVSRKSLPPSRVMELRIDLVPDMTPISKAAYRMTPNLLDEMKK